MKKVAITVLLLGIPFVATGEKFRQIFTGKTPRGSVFIGTTVPRHLVGLKVTPLPGENRIVMVTEKAETMYERLLRKTLPGRQFQVGNVFVLSGNFSAESSQTIAAKPEKSDESSVSRAVLSSSSPASGARKISKAEQEAPILEWAQSLSPEDPRLRETDPTGRTALHNALHHKYVRVAELLIQKGSDVHHRDQEGFTPLHITAFHGLSEIANLLISKGADVNAQTPSGKTPLTIARMNNYFTLYDFLTKNGGRE